MNPGPLSLRRILLVLGVIFLTNSLPAQSQKAPQQLSSANAESLSPRLLHQLETIKSAALDDDYAYQQLAHLTENIGPRPTGSAAARAAVEYVAAQMRDLGLDVHLEECKVRHWVRGTETAELVDYAGHATGMQQKIIAHCFGREHVNRRRWNHRRYSRRQRLRSA